MKTPALVVLGAVTAAAVIAAGVAVHGRAPSAVRAGVGGGEPVFSSLAGKADSIAQIVITRAGGNTFTLTKKDAQWVLADRGSFPARAEQANKAAEALASLKLMEPKTAKAALLSRLDTDDPTTDSSKATLVTLKNAQGTEIGRVILGKARPDSLENPRAGVYARRPNEARAWLAEGDPKIAPSTADWVERTVVAVKAEQVRRVATVSADGAGLAVSRQKPEDKDFAVENLPAGDKIKNQASVNELANTLDALLLDDVRASGGVEFPANAEKAEFARFDGLVVRLTLAKVKDNTWVKVAAAAEPWNKTEDGKIAAVEPSADAKKEAAELNARLEGFAFKLTESAAKKLATRLADLAEKEEKKS